MPQISNPESRAAQLPSRYARGFRHDGQPGGEDAPQSGAAEVHRGPVVLSHRGGANVANSSVFRGGLGGYFNILGLGGFKFSSYCF